MESPGEYLKREREHRGISLEDVFRATRVPLKHLRALEADNFDSMPHHTFVKGYIKSYCKVLGVDETDAVLRYEIYLKDKAGPVREEAAPARPSQPRRIERPPLLGQFWGDKRNVIMAAVGAAVAVIVIVALLVFSFMGPKDEMADVHEEQTTAQSADVAVNTDPIVPVQAEPARPAEPVKPVKTEEKAPEAEKPAAPAHKPHALIVKATDTVWIEATIDGGEPFDITLKDEESVVWKAAENFVLKVGNAGGVSLTLDGKPVAPLGEPGYVVRVELPEGKVKVLAKPKPEVLPIEDIKEPEPAPGVDIKQLLPTLPPEPKHDEGVKTPVPVAAPEGDVKTSVPAATTEGDVKTPVPAATPEGDVKTSVPAAALEGGVKTSVPAATPEGDVKTSVPAAAPEGDVKTSVPAAALEGDVKTSVPAAAPEGDVKTPADGEEEAAEMPPAP